MNKKVTYWIDDVDDPYTLWRMNLDNTTSLCSTGSVEWGTGSLSATDWLRNTDKYRQIPKREAKSLFPEAFK